MAVRSAQLRLAEWRVVDVEVNPKGLSFPLNLRDAACSRRACQYSATCANMVGETRILFVAAHRRRISSAKALANWSATWGSASLHRNLASFTDWGVIGPI
jgi:hypothetical protein